MSMEAKIEGKMEEKLIFLIGTPRSGSTLLSRMLGSNSAIYNRSEPHLLTPLAHLGYFGSVQKAPYDPFNVTEAIHGVVEEMPGKEADYLAACRAYTDIVYRQLLVGSGRTMFLDKTPAYALVLPFITKLYPQARYVVQTRNPVAIFSSYVASFFDGDYEVAQAHNPILDRYVPAIAQLLRDRPVPLIHVRYEDVVQSPPDALEAICAFLNVPFEPGMVEYGKHQHDESGLGDPLGVKQHDRPVTTSLDRWTEEFAGDEPKIAFVRDLVLRLDPDDLRVWGYDQDALVAALDGARGKPARRKPSGFDRYRMQRKLLIALRRNIHQNALGRVLKRARFALDVVLRE